jgi:hypothetical protein
MTEVIKVTHEYDQDPRYGWASVDIGDNNSVLVIINSACGGSQGFTYYAGEMTPTCLCNAWSASECACGLYENDDYEGDD